MLFLLFITVIFARQWGTEYVQSLTEMRSCYPSHYLGILDSFISPLNESSLRDYYGARTFSILAHRLDRSDPICAAIVATATQIYRELMWHKRQENRRMIEKKVVPRQERTDVDTTIESLVEALTSGRIKNRCLELGPQTEDERKELHECSRQKRKESMNAYTRFIE